MSKSVERVRRALGDNAIPDLIRVMPETTRTAGDAAAALGCETDQIAKSVVFRGAESDRVFLFVTAGGNRVDTARAAILAGEPVVPADPAFVRQRTGFAIGGVAPLGHLAPPRAFLDARLLDFDVVWAAAGTPRHVFQVDPGVLRAACGAPVAAFAEGREKM